MNDDLNHNDPWERGVYQTGSTQPPKRRGALTAVLLVAVIFLAGIAGILGVWNIRLFAALQEKTGSDISLSLQDDGRYESLGSHLQATEVTIPQEAGPSIDLSDAPKAEETLSQPGGLSLQEIYEKSIDSVVSISCSTQSGTATGTGLVISADGYLITNYHVIEDASYVTVQLTDQRVLPAAVVGKDAASDLAVLYVEAEDLTAAEFGNSDSLRVGDSVCAIGDPLGVELRGTMTDGIVSAINRDISANGRTMRLTERGKGEEGSEGVHGSFVLSTDNGQLSLHSEGDCSLLSVVLLINGIRSRSHRCGRHSRRNHRHSCRSRIRSHPDR